MDDFSQNTNYSKFRQKYPEYNEFSDEILLNSIYEKRYAPRGIEKEGFLQEFDSKYKDEVGDFQSLFVNPLAGGTLDVGEGALKAGRYLFSDKYFPMFYQALGNELKKSEELNTKYDAPKEIQGSLLDKPELLKDWKWWAYNLNRMVPFTLASIATGVGTGALVTRSAIAGSIQIGNMALSAGKVAVGAGTLASSMHETLVEAGSVHEQMVREGYSNEEADNAANKTFASNIVLNTAINAIEIGKLFKSSGILPTKENIEYAAKSLTRKALTGAKDLVLYQGFPEAFQEGTQNIISQVAMGKDPKEGALESTILGFASGILFGIGGKVLVKGSTPNPEDLSAQFKIGREDLLKSIREDLAKRKTQQVATPISTPVPTIAEPIIGEAVKGLQVPTPQEVPTVTTSPQGEVNNTAQQIILPTETGIVEETPAASPVLPTESSTTQTATQQPTEVIPQAGEVASPIDFVQQADIENKTLSDEDLTSVINQKIEIVNTLYPSIAQTLSDAGSTGNDLHEQNATVSKVISFMQTLNALNREAMSISSLVNENTIERFTSSLNDYELIQKKIETTTDQVELEKLYSMLPSAFEKTLLEEYNKLEGSTAPEKIALKDKAKQAIVANRMVRNSMQALARINGTTLGQVYSQAFKSFGYVSMKSDRHYLLSSIFSGVPSRMVDKNILVDSRGEDVTLGTTQQLLDGQYTSILDQQAQSIVRLYKGANFSTFSHELFHVVSRLFPQTDIKVLEEFLGKTKDHWTIDDIEKTAYAFESYLKDPKQFTKSKLQNIFSKIREWVSSSLRAIGASDLNIEINDDMKKMFNKYFLEPELFTDVGILSDSDGNLVERLNTDTRPHRIVGSLSISPLLADERVAQIKSILGYDAVIIPYDKDTRVEIMFFKDKTDPRVQDAINLRMQERNSHTLGQLTDEQRTTLGRAYGFNPSEIERYNDKYNKAITDNFTGNIYTTTAGDGKHKNYAKVVSNENGKVSLEYLPASFDYETSQNTILSQQEFDSKFNDYYSELGVSKEFAEQQSKRAQASRKAKKDKMIAETNPASTEDYLGEQDQDQVGESSIINQVNSIEEDVDKPNIQAGPSKKSINIAAKQIQSAQDIIYRYAKNNPDSQDRIKKEVQKRIKAIGELRQTDDAFKSLSEEEWVAVQQEMKNGLADRVAKEMLPKEVWQAMKTLGNRELNDRSTRMADLSRTKRGEEIDEAVDNVESGNSVATESLEKLRDEGFDQTAEMDDELGQVLFQTVPRQNTVNGYSEDDMLIVSHFLGISPDEVAGMSDDTIESMMKNKYGDDWVYKIVAPTADSKQREQVKKLGKSFAKSIGMSADQLINFMGTDRTNLKEAKEKIFMAIGMPQVLARYNPKFMQTFLAVNGMVNLRNKIISYINDSPTLKAFKGLDKERGKKIAQAITDGTLTKNMVEMSVGELEVKKLADYSNMSEEQVANWVDEYNRKKSEMGKKVAVKVQDGWGKVWTDTELRNLYGLSDDEVAIYRGLRMLADDLVEYDKKTARIYGATEEEISKRFAGQGYFHLDRGKGPWALKYNDPTSNVKYGWMRFESREDAVEARKELIQRGFIINQDSQEFMPYMVRDIKPEYFGHSSYDDLIALVNDRTDDVSKIRQDNPLLSEILDDIAASRWSSARKIKRRGVGILADSKWLVGALEDWGANVATRHARATADASIKSSLLGVDKRSVWMAYTRDYIDRVITPNLDNTKFWDRTRKFTYYYMLAWNIKNAMVNATQVISTVPGFLLEKQHNLSMSEVDGTLLHYLKKYPSFLTENLEKLYNDKEMEARAPGITEAIRKAVEDAVIAGSLTNALLTSEKGRDRLSAIAGIMQRITEIANRGTAFVTTYDLTYNKMIERAIGNVALAKKLANVAGLSQEENDRINYRTPIEKRAEEYSASIGRLTEQLYSGEIFNNSQDENEVEALSERKRIAYKYAEFGSNETQFIYGKTNYPRFVVAKTWLSQPMKSAFLFKGFTYNYVGNLITSLQKERLRPMQQLHYYAPLIFLAGMSGLPFADDIKELLRRAGIVDIDFAIRELMGSDNQFVSDAVLKGAVPTALGIDISKSAGAGNVLPRGIVQATGNLLNGNPNAIPEGVANFMLDLFGGAPISVSEKYYEAMDAAARGELSMSAELLAPQFASSVIESFRWALSDKNIIDKKDRLIVKDPSNYEVAVNLMSFKPLRQAKAEDFRRAVRFMEDTRRDAVQNFNRKIADAIVSRDQDDLSNIFLEIAQYNLKHRTRPYDWNRQKNNVENRILQREIEDFGVVRSKKRYNPTGYELSKYYK